jgi:hypothetical protein
MGSTAMLVVAVAPVIALVAPRASSEEATTAPPISVLHAPDDCSSGRRRGRGAGADR